MTLDIGVQILAAIIMAVMGYFIRRLDKDQERQDGRLSHIEDTLGVYKEHVAVGTTEVRAIREMMEQHIEREENITWKRIEANENINREAHEKLFNGLAELTGDVRELVGVISVAFKDQLRTDTLPKRKR